MKNFLLFLLILSFILSYSQHSPAFVKERQSLLEPFQNAQFDHPDLANEFEFEKTKDRALGYVPYERLYKAMETTRQTLQNKNAIPDVSWMERGPKNVSGRTRAIMFDPNFASNNKVWAAGITGGLWYNSDVENNGVWNRVDDFWDNIAVSTLAYDPSNPQVFYAGTGEGWTTKSVRGAGIWKSIDAGVSWQKMSSTDNADFYFIQKIITSPLGKVFATTGTGLFISDDGGASWNKVLNGFFGDVEINQNGHVIASQGRFGEAGTVYHSLDSGDNWSDMAITTEATERTELAFAPSNTELIYAVSSVGRDISWFKKSTDGGTTWIDIEIPMYLEQNCVPSSSDFTRSQAWYDLIMKVNPEDENMVYVGGIDWHKTTDGGQSWESVSYWTGACADYVHADQHAFEFFPSDNSKALVGCDGGIFYITDLILGFTSTAHVNNNYNVTQFYGCTMENSSGSNYMLAGAQDNGTQKFTQMGFGTTTQATGGDGGLCFIDQDNSQYQITSYVYNNWRLSTNGGASFSYYPNTTNGQFINPADYDSQTKVLYASSSPDTLFVSNIISDGNSGHYKPIVNGIDNGIISAIRVSKHTSNTLFVGTSSGKIFKITDAESNPTSEYIDINNQSLPTGYISSIDIGESENQILLTYSNYGLASVWETRDGGINWQNIEYNLPDMPIRGCLYNPENTNQILLATETGIWSMNDITTETLWEPSNSGIANVRCDQIKYRDADKMIAVATYGRGLFTSDIFGAPEPIANFMADRTITCPSDTVYFTDISTKNPNQWLWQITPNTFEFLNGTDETSQNPNVRFLQAGNYTVELTATNTAGFGNIVKANYITVNNDCQYIMSDDTLYTCNALFYDSGYTSDYPDGIDYTTTFYPSDPSANTFISAQFNTFDVEYEANCGYDYLKIYDGPSTSYPLIGKYCGNNSPGTITGSLNRALTFQFHSDSYSGGQGWEASIYCDIIETISEISAQENLKIYPNPSSEVLNIVFENNSDWFTIECIDLTGRIIYRSESSEKQTIDVSHFEKGMYFIRVSSKKQSLQKSFIVE